MKQIMILIGKDFRILRRNRSALVLLFVVPLALIYFMGQIWGINQPESSTPALPLGLVSEGFGPQTGRLIAKFLSEPALAIHTTDRVGGAPDLTREKARAAMASADAPFRFAVVIPADFADLSSGRFNVVILANPRNEMEAQMAYGLVQQTLYRAFPEILSGWLSQRKDLSSDEFASLTHRLSDDIAAAYKREPPDIEKALTAMLGSTADARLPNRIDGVLELGEGVVKIEVQRVVGAKVSNPLASAIVGGWAMQFLLFSLSAGAAGLFRERETGIFERLLSNPVSKSQILWAKFFYGVLIGLIQLLVLFAASRFIFGVDILPHLLPLIAVCLCAAAACSSAGMLLAAVSPNAETAGALSTFIILILCALGGAWFPLSLMPEIVQHFSRLSLVYWSLEGFSDVLWAGRNLAQIWRSLLVLSLMSGASMAIAIWRFNRNRIFG